MASDEDALTELMQVSDVTLPHVIKHFLYFPSDETAKMAGASLRERGFDVNDGLGTICGSWAVLAMSMVVPSLNNICELRALLSALADTLGGEYDGWEAEVQGNTDRAP